MLFRYYYLSKLSVFVVLSSSYHLAGEENLYPRRKWRGETVDYGS